MASVSDVDSASTNHDHFTKAFYETIKSTPGNIFFSPLSIETVLALTYMGSEGSTANQLQTSLKLADKNSVLKNVKALNDIVHTNEAITLDIANGVFPNEHFNVREDYIKTAKEYFNAEVKGVQFQNSDEALKIVNSWVDEKTHGKIPTLLSPGSVDADTALVLVNAIYFKGKWLNQFSPKATLKAPFYLSDTDTVEVDFMTKKAQFRAAHNEDLNAYIVGLPYVGEEISMYLIVPQEKTGLPLIEEKLKDLNLVELTQYLRKREIILTMPKFKIEQTIELTDPLKKLGITDLFSSQKCNLKGISEEQQLYVSKALQKSFIEVNEEGSEAAAATGLKIQMRMMPLPPIQITVDSPFIFLITHVDGHFIFGGRLSNPA